MGNYKHCENCYWFRKNKQQEYVYPKEYYWCAWHDHYVNINGVCDEYKDKDTLSTSHYRVIK